MKRARGKQPTKPNLQKALLTRNMELKGSDKATFTIPVIYRKTFGWDVPEIQFVPLNHRGFVIFRGDLEQEEYNREMYKRLRLDIETLKSYTQNRPEKSEQPHNTELKEAILAASLRDRYVHLTIPKPKSSKLYKYLKKDMEELVAELGFEYSTDHQGIQCTFKFPKHDVKYYAMESKFCVQSAINSLNYFREYISEHKFTGAVSAKDDLIYEINRLEVLMDRYYSDSLNIIWDLPNIYCPEYFLWINSCEKILDEFQFIASETNNAIKTLKPDDIQKIGVDRDIFEYVWAKAIESCLGFCENAISTIELEPGENCIQRSFEHIYDYEQHHKTLGEGQHKFIKLFSGEEKYFKDTARAQRILTSSYHLNNIFQAAERVIGLSKSIVQNTLRICMFD
jgi:hypothetical protein